MDTKTKNKIIKLNSDGLGYKKIASTLNISIGSVRNALAEKEETNVCRYCGQKLILIPGKKKKTFCNDSCRYHFWNERKKVSKC